MFAQELYHNFEYNKQKPWFHSFESNEIVYGLSFADDPSAEEFYNQVHIAIKELGGATEEQEEQEEQEDYTHHVQPAQPAYQPPTHHVQPAQPAYQPPVQPVQPAQQPPAAQTLPPTGHVVPPSNSQLTMKLVPIQADTSSKKEDPKKKKGGLFSRFRSGNKKKDQDMEITGPTGFKHESHIGWDLDNGFDIRNIPPEWKKLFQAAGVKKSDLEDPETRKMLASTVGNMLGGTDSGTLSAAVTPPPPPPAAAGPPPPPPPTAGPPSFTAGPPPPPAGGPPPAAAAPPAANSLQAALAAKRGALTKIDEVPAHTHAPPASASAAAAPSLVDTLAAAMAKRRVEIDKNDEEDGWSDDDWSE